MAARYLFLRLSALGDVVFALEALSALKQQEPDATVDWLVEDKASGLVTGHPWIDEVLVFRRKLVSAALPRPWRWPSLFAELWRHFRRLRRHRYDAVLDLHGNLKSGLHLWLSRATRKLGFAPPVAREGAHWFANEHVDVGELPVHRADQGLVMVGRLLSGDRIHVARPLIPVCEHARSRALALLDGAPQLVALAPGTSSFASFKRWPITGFGELAAQLVAQGRTVVVCTGPDEEDLAEPLLNIAGVRWFDGGEHGLAVYLEVLREAAVLVAADSGPLHMAQAVGTDVVGLFGPKDPARYGPRLATSVVLRYPVPCAPCGLRACDAPLCVRAIPVAVVADAVERIMGQAQ